MGRTNIVIADELIEEGKKLTGISTKKDLVSFALKELIKRKKRKALLNLRGKVRWEGNLKEMRKARA